MRPRSSRELHVRHTHRPNSVPAVPRPVAVQARPLVSGEVVDFRAARREQLRLAREGQPTGASVLPTEELDERALRLVQQIEAMPIRDLPESKADAPRASCPPCHYGLMFLTLLLALVSIPVVYSASTAIALEHYNNPNFFLYRQIGFVAVGLGVLLWTSRLGAARIRSLVWVLYAIALGGLLAIKFTPMGTDLGSGTERWLKMGPLPPQQFSELAKIALIGVLADFWSRAARKDAAKLWPWLVTAGLSLPVVVLVFMQPHLSASSLLMLLPFAIAFYAGAPIKQLGKIALVLVALGALGVGCMKPYQRERIASHFTSQDAKMDARGSNYQALQGQRALVRGGLTGQGVGQSMFKQLHLPAPHTDFILAIIGEELGFVGMAVLLTFYGLMIFFCFHTGHCARAEFEALLCAGVGTLLAIQLVCNAGVVMGILPVTGMPLPLLSYGGSGLICTLLGIGLVLGVSRGCGAEEGEAAEDSEEESWRDEMIFDQAVYAEGNQGLRSTARISS